MNDIDDSRSTPSSGGDPRRQTIAFRLTSSERVRIDALARSAGISTSEFARQAVFGGLEAGTSAMDEAREHGRDGMRPQIGKLEEELSRTQKLLARSRESERELYRRVIRAPTELIIEARHLVAGVPGSQVTLAWCWSRIDYHDRCKIVPILATVVAAEVDRAIGELRVNEDDVDWALGLLDRVGWLMDALSPDSGRPYAPMDRKRRPEWEPLEASFIKGAEWIGRCGKLLELRESRSTATVVDAAHWEELSNLAPSLLGESSRGPEESDARVITAGAGPAHHPDGYFDAAGHRQDWPEPGDSPAQTTLPPSEQG